MVESILDTGGGDGAGQGRIEAINPDTYTALMEQLQEAYVASVAATAGCAYERVIRDFRGIDVQLIRPGRSVANEEISVYAQLKSTTTLKPDSSKKTFGYRLKKREYFERLAAPRRDLKLILIVMVTPRRQANWTRASHDQLDVCHCCYWVSLEGMTAPAGVSEPTVQVPTANVFDADALTVILDRLDRGESLNGSTA